MVKTAIEATETFPLILFIIVYIQSHKYTFRRGDYIYYPLYHYYYTIVHPLPLSISKCLKKFKILFLNKTH